MDTCIGSSTEHDIISEERGTTHTEVAVTDVGGRVWTETMSYQSTIDPDEAFDYLFKIVLIGDAGVGKTCVVQRFKSGTYTEKHGSTIGVDFTMKTLNIDGKLVKVSHSLYRTRVGKMHVV